MSRSRRPNPLLVKIHRNYAVEEISRLLDVHRNTVRNWLKNGLNAIDDRRPTLVLGAELRRFLQSRRARKRQPCAPGQLYCVKCRAPREPALKQAEYVPFTASSGNLKGRCPDCGTMMNRRVARARLGEVKGNLKVAVEGAKERIRDTAPVSSNCDFNNDGRTHEIS